MGKEDAFQVKIRPSHLQSRGKELTSDTFCLKKLQWIPVKLLVLTTFRQFSASLFSSQWRGSNLDLPFFMMWFSYRYASLILLPTKPSRFASGNCLFWPAWMNSPNVFQILSMFHKHFRLLSITLFQTEIDTSMMDVSVTVTVMHVDDIAVCVVMVPGSGFYPSSKFFNFWTFVFASLLNFENGRVRLQRLVESIYLSSYEAQTWGLRVVDSFNGTRFATSHSTVGSIWAHQ